MLNTITKTLFKYQTDNGDEKPSPNILPCLQELALLFKKEGVHCELQKYQVGNNKDVHTNLLAFNPELTPPYILLQGHIDTVPFNQPYQFKITNNSIAGRGAVDMKGPLAGMIQAFIELYKKDYKYPPALLITGDEEANSFAGIKEFLKKKNFPILFAINGEPTNFSVGLKFYGIMGYSLEKKGLGGHSASLKNDFLIEQSIPAIQAIENFIKKSRKIENKNFGKTIGAFTVINSGQKSNQLPEYFKVAWNLRIVRESKNYERIFQSTIGKIIDSSFSLKSFYYNPMESKLNQNIKSCIKKGFTKTKISYREKPIIFFTEASLLSENNIPTIVCGPGNPDLAHMQANKEIIKVSDINRYTDLIKNIIYEQNNN